MNISKPIVWIVKIEFIIHQFGVFISMEPSKPHRFDLMLESLPVLIWMGIYLAAIFNNQVQWSRSSGARYTNPRYLNTSSSQVTRNGVPLWILAVPLLTTPVHIACSESDIPWNKMKEKRDVYMSFVLTFSLIYRHTKHYCWFSHSSTPSGSSSSSWLSRQGRLASRQLGGDK